MQGWNAHRPAERKETGDRLNTSLFIASYRRDFQYLKHCVRSINKNCRGFHQVVIQIPDTDWEDFTDFIGPETMSQKEINYVVIAGKEWPERGMLWHMREIVHADQHCRNADFIGHFDSDAIFTEPVTPETFIKEGKPYLQYERFESIGRRHPGVLQWQRNAQACLPFPIHYESMRGLPHFYEINTYEKARELMVQHTGMSVDDWIGKGPNKYPQEFCEHVTLGNVAIHCFHEDYELIDMALQANPDRSRWPVVQLWSHGAIDKPQNIWIYGEQKIVVPMAVFAHHGLAQSAISSPA